MDLKQPNNIIGLFILIGALVAGYYLYSENLASDRIPAEQGITENNLIADWQTYKNDKYNYEINYPNDWTSELLADGSGSIFKPVNGSDEFGYIKIEESGRGLESCDVPFDKYVTFAAAENIQGYDELKSIEPVTSKSGEKGFKTTWVITGFDGKASISGPITYFDDLARDCNNREGEVTLTLDGSSEYESVYKFMISTFKFGK